MRPKLRGCSTGSSGSTAPEATGALVAEIESLAETLGRGLYRGILRDLARVWNAREIHDVGTQGKVLVHMRAAERGLKRLEAALDRTGPDALAPILKSIGVKSLECVDSLQTLKKIVLDLEDAMMQQN